MIHMPHVINIIPDYPRLSQVIPGYGGHSGAPRRRTRNPVLVAKAVYGTLGKGAEAARLDISSDALVRRSDIGNRSRARAR